MCWCGLDPEVAAAWSDEEVVRRWGRLFPPRDKKRQPLPVSNDWVAWRLKDAAWVAKARDRLQSLSWFMKCLKEPLARLANFQDKTRGFFFEGRFKSVAILDEESLLATCAYIDLNPVAAGIAEVPETSKHTSVKERVDHVKAQGRTEDLKAAREGASPDQRRRPDSRNRTGCVPLRTVAESIRREKGCWKDFRWAVTCFWSITAGAYSAKARRRFRGKWPRSSNESAEARRLAGSRLRTSRRAEAGEMLAFSVNRLIPRGILLMCAFGSLNIAMESTGKHGS